MWSKLMPKEVGFFDLFNKHARMTMDGIKKLVSVAENWPKDAEPGIRTIQELEHECDSITHMTVDLMHRTFITPLDRDEILDLISKMDDVMDSINTASHRLLLFKVPALPNRLVEMTRVFLSTQEQVLTVVEKMRGFKHVNELRDILKEIHRLENEGDELVHAGLAALFTDFATDPLSVIKFKEIYEIVERGIDQCEDVANIVEGIVLEHS
jgi:uncharacterized protein